MDMACYNQGWGSRIAWLLCLGVLAAMDAGLVHAEIRQNIVIVLDDSGSMAERMQTKNGRVRRIDAAKSALTSVLSRLPENTSVGVLTLNTRVDGSHWIVPLGPADPNVLQQNIQRIKAKGGTPLGQYLQKGADQLLQMRATQVYGDFRLLVVTDGEANDRRLVEAYLPDILSRGIVIDVIGVDMQDDHSLAKRVHNYRRADDDNALEQAISQVFAETSADDQDIAAEFDMLASLPDEFAVQALEALAKPGDGPIQGKSGQGGGVNEVNNSFQRSSSQSGGIVGSALGGMLCCAGAFAMMLILVSLIFASRKSPPRR